MKKFTAFFAIAAAFTFSASAQESNPVSVGSDGTVISGNSGASWSPTVTAMGGGAIEYKDLTPQFSVDLLSVSASVGYESKYVFRGEKLAASSVQSSIDFAYPIYGFDIYAGAFNSSPISGTQHEDLNELDLYTGVNYFMGSVRFDLGFIYYWFPEGAFPGRTSGDMEVYTGITFDSAAYTYINLNPSIYYYYSWDLEQHVVEASMTYNMPVGDWLISDKRLSMPINAYFGYLNSTRMNDGKTVEFPSVGEIDARNAEYFYTGASIDIAFAIKEYCTISAGARYAYRFNDKGAAAKELMDDHANNFWFGGKVHFGF